VNEEGRRTGLNTPDAVALATQCRRCRAQSNGASQPPRAGGRVPTLPEGTPPSQPSSSAGSKTARCEVIQSRLQPPEKAQMDDIARQRRLPRRAARHSCAQRHARSRQYRHRRKSALARSYDRKTPPSFPPYARRQE